MNIAAWLKHAKVTLRPSSSTPSLDAELLLMKVLRVSRVYCYTHDDQQLSEANFETLEQLLARRSQGEPMAYITGTQAFWSMDLQVNSATLIPRPETELLVETALACIEPEYSAKILDLGTGSGAIALALASERPMWHITAVDNSKAALTLAKHNQARQGLNNLTFIYSHWFSALANQQFHMIVSNPPYIEPNDPHLKALSYEPKTALVAKHQGLADLQQIIQLAPKHLLSSAYLLLEHGYNQAQSVTDALMLAGFESVMTRQDLNGQDRLTMARFSSHKR